jgi:hypothetical protein
LVRPAFFSTLRCKEDNGMFFHLYLTSVSKYLGDNFSFGFKVLYKIDKYVNFAPGMAGSDSRGMVVSNPGDLMYYGVDASVKYSFMKLIN